jgi:hypothetical protein
MDSVATQLVSDDFDIVDEGRVYLPPHFLNSVVQLDLDGSRATIAGPTSASSAAPRSRSIPTTRPALIAATTGCMRGATRPGAEPARLVRLRLHHHNPSSNSSKET